jgi:hypothetical protein
MGMEKADKLIGGYNLDGQKQEHLAGNITVGTCSIDAASRGTGQFNAKAHLQTVKVRIRLRRKVLPS